MRIWIALLVISGLAIVYILIPNRENVERQNQTLEVYREEIAQALEDCSKLLDILKGRKSTQQRKVELQRLRQKFLDLKRKADDVLEDDTLEPRLAADRLEEMAPRFYDLKRDAEDLRARLRVMVDVDEKIRGLISKIGRHTKALSSLKLKSGDLSFNQQVDDLFEESKRFRAMAEKGLATIAKSIVQGRPIALAAVNELAGVEKRMTELIAAREESN